MPLLRSLCAFTAAWGFTVSGAWAAPQITGFSPRYGTPGTEVVVQGQHLVASGDPTRTTVWLGNVDQTVVTATGHQLSFRVSQESKSAQISITTPQGTAQSGG
jgi:hypothetical protein